MLRLVENHDHSKWENEYDRKNLAMAWRGTSDSKLRYELKKNIETAWRGGSDRIRYGFATANNFGKQIFEKGYADGSRGSC